MHEPLPEKNKKCAIFHINEAYKGVLMYVWNLLSVKPKPNIGINKDRSFMWNVLQPVFSKLCRAV